MSRRWLLDLRGKSRALLCLLTLDLTGPRLPSLRSMSTERKLESVWEPPYTRPPTLEPSPRRLRVIYVDPSTKERITLADTTKGYRVLETSHPPTYYIPPSDVKLDLLKPNARSSFCEWKGRASYHDCGNIRARIWSYPDPSPRFRPIKDYMAFYATSYECSVDDEKVIPQEGDFYGSWLTSSVAPLCGLPRC
ncbi:uncharacterized protein L969DRAFT_73392 [Mixia osmundae IAM 14324]|uniref:uncharacterized protein n=1 Tax=Mixia osmundae (strain CBS 9802 / IAM 14324 / JCM 22182 / KY 12970) TaxID=764103 RepID=UPI0004A552FF|nr:uncharacterized protein L969DRAFT_73392 [Mixia osmundae IAM 14324]KEI40056.1 hypothetical protein L969DRAFT_73392 [Mixia osmundae IAM 14324]